MKKVEFMKLNLQQENLLSKKERKEILGGYVEGCYVLCSGQNRKPLGDCSPYSAANVCGNDRVISCSCPPEKPSN